MSTKITFDMPDFSLVLQNATEKTLQEAGQKVTEEAIRTAPTGENAQYKGMIVHYVNEHIVAAEAPYSADIEYGTKAHIIEPKNADALHFTTDGQEVFTKRVNHPGTKPNPVMRNAAHKVQKQIGGMFYSNFQKDLKKYRQK